MGIEIEKLVPGPGVEPPKQDRSRRSYNRILEATAELLADRPFDDISIDEIVARAGYTKGAFYHRFDGKATLLRHLVARLTTGAQAAWDGFLDPAAWEGAPLRDVLDAYVHRLVAIHSRSTHLMRALAGGARWGDDDAIRATADELNRHVLARLLALVESRRDELAAPARRDPGGAVRFWNVALTSLLQSIYLWPDPALGADPTPAVVEERAQALLVPFLAR